MFVRILQILVLLAIINTSTTYVIRDITTYNTTTYDVNNDDPKYPTHNVNFHVRGYTARVLDTCIHFIDNQMESKLTYCSNTKECPDCFESRQSRPGPEDTSRKPS